MQNITKVQLVDEISTVAGSSKTDAAKFVEAFVDVVTKQLQAGNKVTITGFGAFKTSDRSARTGVNPKTGAKLEIPAMTVPKFTAGNALKDAVR
jgi:DNA-binding protein HU-beta